MWNFKGQPYQWLPRVSVSILRLSVVEAAGLAGLPGSVLSSASGVRASLLHAGTSQHNSTTSGGSERECRETDIFIP